MDILFFWHGLINQSEEICKEVRFDEKVNQNIYCRYENHTKRMKIVQKVNDCDTNTQLSKRTKKERLLSIIISF